MVLHKLFDFFKVVILVLICTVIIRFFLFQPFIVEGASMEPNYHNQEYLLVEKLSYRIHSPSRGDVIVFRYPNDPSVNYIKRIIGLPGDTVRIENGQVSINGNILNEPYLTGSQITLIRGSASSSYQTTVEPEHYFVMGDNRSHSSDSRDGWQVSTKAIIGRSLITLYKGQAVQIVPVQTLN